MVSKSEVRGQKSEVKGGRGVNSNSVVETESSSEEKRWGTYRG
jgi:hypothetical protein